MQWSVGMNLALMELKITLLKLVSKFNFTLADPKMNDERNILGGTTFTMKPKDGLPILIQKRNVSSSL